MADKTIIAAKISVETGEASANVKGFNSDVNAAKDSLDSISGTAGKTSGAISGASGSFGKLKQSITSIPGPVGQAAQGVQGLGTAFKALLANPVGIVLTAIAGILTLLYKGFTNTFEGANKVEQVFAGIKATGQALLDNLGKIASAIKNVFTFNFSAAIKDIKEVGNAAVNAYSQMSKLTAEAQKLKREQAQNDYDSIERQAKLADLKEKLADSDVDPKEKIRLGKELLALSEQNAKEDLDLAKRTAENKIAQLTLEKDGERKNQEEILKIRGEQKKGEIENANEIRAVRKAVARAEKEDAAAQAAIAKEAADRQKEANEKYKEALKEKLKIAQEQQELQDKFREAVRKGREEEAKQLEAEYAASQKEQARIEKAEADRIANNEKTRLENKKKNAELAALDNPEDPTKKIALLNAQLALELNALAEGDIQKQILAKKTSDEIVKIREGEADAKIRLAQVEKEAEQAKVSAIGAAFGNLADIAGKQTAAGKAFAIAQATIDTYQSAISSYKSLSGIPVVGPVLGAIAAAAAIATGVSTVKKILSVNVPGKGGGGGGAAPSLSVPAAPLAPTQTSTKIDQASLSQMGNSTVRAFIVDTDATNSRERNERLNRASRLGG